MQRVLKYHLLLKVGAISLLQTFNAVKFKLLLLQRENKGRETKLQSKST